MQVWIRFSELHNFIMIAWRQQVWTNLSFTPSLEVSGLANEILPFTSRATEMCFDRIIQNIKFLHTRMQYKCSKCVRYVLHQVHYNNMELRGGVSDSSGFQISVTPNLRPHDMGVVTVGQRNLTIPPGLARLEAPVSVSLVTALAIPVQKAVCAFLLFSWLSLMWSMRQELEMFDSITSPCFIQSPLHTTYESPLLTSYLHTDT